MTITHEILNVTSTALEHIRKVIAKKNNAVGFRISIKRTGCSGYMYVPEVVQQIKSEDYRLPCDSLAIFLDTQCIPMLRGTTLDLVKKNFGFTQLQFNNPNAKGLCGCGESFHLNEESV